MKSCEQQMLLEWCSEKTKDDKKTKRKKKTQVGLGRDERERQTPGERNRGKEGGAIEKKKKEQTKLSINKHEINECSDRLRRSNTLPHCLSKNNKYQVPHSKGTCRL